VLNIGKLSAGATEYYIGEVASSAEHYYSGRGEHPGRWVGSLADELGLSGEVEPEQFRRVLLGKHPHSDEFLVTAQGGSRGGDDVDLSLVRLVRQAKSERRRARPLKSKEPCARVLDDLWSVGAQPPDDRPA
jgi:hypothetical protein